MYQVYSQSQLSSGAVVVETTTTDVATPEVFKQTLAKLAKELAEVFSVQNEVSKLGKGEVFFIPQEVLGLTNMPLIETPSKQMGNYLLLGRKEVRTMVTLLTKAIMKLNADYGKAYRYKKARAGPQSIIKLTDVGQYLLQLDMGPAWKVQVGADFDAIIERNSFVGPAELRQFGGKDLDSKLIKIKRRLDVIDKLGNTVSEGQKKLTKKVKLEYRKTQYEQEARASLSAALHVNEDGQFKGFVSRSMVTQVWPFLGRGNGMDRASSADINTTDACELYRFYTRLLTTFARRWKSDVDFVRKRSVALSGLTDEKLAVATAKWDKQEAKKLKASLLTELNVRRKVYSGSDRLRSETIPAVVFGEANTAMITSLRKKLSAGDEYDEFTRKLEDQPAPVRFDEDTNQIQRIAEELFSDPKINQIFGSLQDAIQRGDISILGIKEKTLKALALKRQNAKVIVDRNLVCISEELFHHLDLQYMTGVPSVSSKVDLKLVDSKDKEELLNNIKRDSITLSIAKHATEVYTALAEFKTNEEQVAISPRPGGQQFGGQQFGGQQFGGQQFGAQQEENPFAASSSNQSRTPPGGLPL